MSLQKQVKSWRKSSSLSNVKNSQINYYTKVHWTHFADVLTLVYMKFMQNKWMKMEKTEKSLNNVTEGFILISAYSKLDQDLVVVDDVVCWSQVETICMCITFIPLFFPRHLVRQRKILICRLWLFFCPFSHFPLPFSR